MIENHLEPLSNNSYRCQHKIDAQAMEIATAMAELNHALEENCKLKEMFNPDQLVDVILKVVNNIAVKEGPQTAQGTQYHSIPG